jgi:hypothetical protein
MEGKLLNGATGGVCFITRNLKSEDDGDEEVREGSDGNEDDGGSDQDAPTTTGRSHNKAQMKTKTKTKTTVPVVAPAASVMHVDI